MKPVVSELSQDEKSCKRRFETKSCDPIPCLWWHVGLLKSLNYNRGLIMAYLVKKKKSEVLKW